MPARSPHETLSVSPTWVNIATSTSLKSPARMKYAFVPTSSSAVPVQIRSVPGRCSRSMIFFTASAAVMLTACPELCPSPWPGAPSMIGSCQATPGFCDAWGMQSMSDPSAMTGLPDPHVAMNAVGTPAMPSWTANPFFFEDVDQVPVGLELLKAELPVAEDLVDHLLRELGAALDVGDRLLLERLQLRVRGRRLRRRLLRERRGGRNGDHPDGDDPGACSHGAGLYPREAVRYSQSTLNACVH